MLLQELAEPAGALLEHHLEITKIWYPHEEVPFELARRFTRDDPWTPDEYPLDPGVRSAIFVNLLTEDNLPYYTHTILSQLKGDHPLRDWSHQWTTEEWRHSAVIRDWVLATRAIDPTALEDARRIQMRLGKVPEPPSLAETLVYTSLQELATQVAHRNTGKRLDRDRLGRRVMALVAGDEGLHHDFYSGLVSEAIRIDPSTMVIAAFNQLRGFKMPGTGIPNFEEHARAIEKARIYDVPQFFDLVVTPTFDKWGINTLEDITPEAQKARDAINKHLALLGRIVRRQLEKDALGDAQIS